jgi:hypothetical protein
MRLGTAPSISPVIDTTHKIPQAVAAELADILRKPRT